MGMGKALYEAFPSARAVFDEADDALSQHLARLIFEGPDETLKLTANTQPAIMTTSVAALRALENELDVKLSPAFGAGHSLGEYTALVASGVLAFRDAVDLVNKRGRWMQESAPEGVGAMAAIMGMEPADIVAVCREVAPNEECQAANFNSPGQVVISGVAEYVDRAVAAAAASSIGGRHTNRRSCPLMPEPLSSISISCHERTARTERPVSVSHPPGGAATRTCHTQFASCCAPSALPGKLPAARKTNAAPSAKTFVSESPLIAEKNRRKGLVVEKRLVIEKNEKKLITLKNLACPCIETTAPLESVALRFAPPHYKHKRL